jgi:hypothetical protein
MLGAWAHSHGLAALEVAGHLLWADPDCVLRWREEPAAVADRPGLPT